MKLRTLEDLFIAELRDIYDAEKQLLKALPKMSKAASHEELRSAFDQHLGETEGQVERLERVFELFDHKARGKTCEAMEGLIEEGKDVIGDIADPAVGDAALICAAQKVEHYEIAAYGCLATWARQLGRDEAARLLEQTLQEEKNADQKLNGIAEGHLNAQAAGAAG